MKNQNLVNKDILKINSLPLIVLTSFGHCGADYIGNLFYGHAEILKAPDLSFFRKIQILKKQKKIDIIQIKDINKIYKILKNYFLTSRNINSYNYFTNKKKERLFKKYFFEYLRGSEIKKKQKLLFLAIYYGVAKTYGIKINKLKYIFTHETVSGYCNKYKKYFNLVKFITVNRDPRAAFAGTLKNGIISKISYEYQIDRAFFNWITGFNFYLKEKKINNIFLLQNEKFNGKKFKQIMKDLSKWLKIKFDKSLLIPKYFNKKWYGDSIYLNKYELKKPLPKNYYQIKNVKLRWLKQLTKKELSDIENILRYSMNFFSYKSITKITFSSAIKAYLNYLFLYKPKRILIKNIYYTFKNLIRRTLIIKNPNLASKLFNLD